MKKPEFFKKKLGNGLTVILEKRELPIVSISYSVKSGAVNESLEEKGISHFIEHLMFKGTKKRTTKEIAEEIEKRGGEINGFTNDEMVAYFCKLPSEHLSVGLDVLTDAIKNPLFEKEEIEKERQVIFEEIKMYNDNPSHYSLLKIPSLLYEGTLGEFIAGDKETVSNISREDMVKKFNEIYVPGNMVLTVVGNADFEELCDFAEKNFSSENKGKINEEKIKLKNESLIEKRPGLVQANMVFAHHIPLIDDKKGNYSAKVLNNLLAGGMSSRLFTEIREKRNLAYAVKGDSDDNKRFGYNLIFVGCMPENVDKIKNIILDEYKKIFNTINEDELEQAKKQLIGNYKISMEDSQSQMINLFASEIQGKAEDFYDFEENINSVGIEDLKKIVNKVVEGNYSFFALLPEDK
mgnify:CR=1 FL=1